MKEPKKKEIVPKLKQSVSKNIHYSLNQKKKIQSYIYMVYNKLVFISWTFFYLIFWGRKKSITLNQYNVEFCRNEWKIQNLELNTLCLIESNLCWLALHACWHSCKVPNKLSLVIIISWIYISYIIGITREYTCELYDFIQLWGSHAMRVKT